MELIVAISVVAILVTIVAMMISSARTKAGEIETVSQMRTLAQQTLLFVYDNNGSYPNATYPTWDIQILNFMQGRDSSDIPEYDSDILLSPLDRVKRINTPPNARSYSLSGAIGNWFGWDDRWPQFRGAPAVHINDPARTIRGCPIRC